MATKIMQKPYHIAGYDKDDKELYRLTVMPPTLAGANEDGKKPKDSDGNWIRTFTVTDSGNSSYSNGDKITMIHPRGEYPHLDLDDNITLRLEAIEGVKATKKTSSDKPKKEKKEMKKQKAKTPSKKKMVKVNINKASELQTDSNNESVESEEVAEVQQAD